MAPAKDRHGAGRAAGCCTPAQIAKQPPSATGPPPPSAAHLLQHAGLLALLHALDGIVLDGLLLAAFVHHRVLALADLLVYAAAQEAQQWWPGTVVNTQHAQASSQGTAGSSEQAAAPRRNPELLDNIMKPFEVAALATHWY